MFEYDKDKMGMYEGALKKVSEGEVVKGKIVSITSKEVVVDIGYKSEGIIPLEEFMDPASIKVGDEIEVYVESLENEDGALVLSKKRAERTQGWDTIVGKCKEGEYIQGKVTKRIKGGYSVDIGVEAFLPASQASLRGEGYLQISQNPILFQILKINNQRRNIVLSRKNALQKERDETRVKALVDLNVGDVKEGVVKNITNFGAFVSLGTIDGLLHITDISWEKINHPSDVLKVGEKVKIVILNIDKNTHKISLGLKQTQPSPWKDAEAKYPVGMKVKGKVMNILPYGAFVEIEKGIKGLVHVSEISWTKRLSSPSEVLSVGDEVEAVVLSIDAENEKLSLGIKQTQDNPWLKIGEKYSVGTRVKGKVRNFTDYGAFIELEEGIDGLVHVSDLSWIRKVNHPSEILKKGDEVEAVVLSVDADARKISLGLKQLAPDPWEEMIRKYPIGTNVDCTVKKLTAFGAFVELEPDLEGLIHISEIDLAPNAKLEDKLKVGDRLNARVIKLDNDQRKIGLSARV